MVKLLRSQILIDKGSFSTSKTWQETRAQIAEAIGEVQWPKGSGSFTIHPGKHFNGVKPIKVGFVLRLQQHGWLPESSYLSSGETSATISRPGSFDVRRSFDLDSIPPFVVEWETGNISSSHRAMNKMTMALQEGRISGGALVLPSRRMYRHLTDRIGNYQEMEPYFDFYRRSSATVENGLLEIIEIEHDAESTDVPIIGKGTDGRALI